MITQGHLKILVIAAVGLSVLTMKSGCSSERDTADVNDNSLRQKIGEYITTTMAQYKLQDRGIKMGLRETDKGLRICVSGEVPDSDSLKVLQAFLESPYTNPDLPVPLVWAVTVKNKG